MKQKEPEFIKKEREIALGLCGPEPTEAEIQWYLDKLEIFATGTTEQTDAAMNALIAGYHHRGNSRM